MTRSNALRLIEELKNDPEMFYAGGIKSNQLLQEFYDGFNKGVLRELLHSENKCIKRVSLWITTEPGDDCVDLVRDVVPLVSDRDYYICCLSLQVMAFYSRNINDLMAIFKFLEHDNLTIRIFLMLILSTLRTPRLLEAIENLPAGSHKEGLMCLISISEQDANSINAIIDSDDPIIRKYGIMAAFKLYTKIPSIMRNAVNSQDSDVREFAKRMLSAKE